MSRSGAAGVSYPAHWEAATPPTPEMAPGGGETASPLAGIERALSSVMETRAQPFAPGTKIEHGGAALRGVSFLPATACDMALYRVQADDGSFHVMSWRPTASTSAWQPCGPTRPVRCAAHPLMLLVR